jgi:hypothetical protein
MTNMNIFLSILLPCFLIVGVLLLRPLRSWLESGARRVKARAELIEEYHTNAMFFLKNTDAQMHASSREVVVSIGDRMMDGTKLVRGILFAAKSKSSDVDLSKEVSEHMAALPDDAKHALGKALGAALLVSTFQSRLFGSTYRSVLMLVLRDNDREIKEPEQIVYRFGRANSLWNGSLQRTC